MSTLVVLGQPPKVFSREVTFIGVDGAEMVIPCTFMYRTREEFGMLIDDAFAEPEGDPFNGNKFSLGKQQTLTCRTTGKYLRRILVNWGLDVPLTDQACMQLAGELPAGAQAVMDVYRNAILDGRLGN